MTKTLKSLRKYSPRDVLTIFVLAFISLALLFAKVKILLPKITDLKAKWEALSQNRREAEIVINKANFLTSLDRATLESSIETANRGLPVEVDIVSLIDTIEGIAAFSGTKVGSINLSPGKISTESAIIQTKQENLSLGLTFTGAKSDIESIPSYFLRAAPLFSISNLDIAYSTSGLAKIDVSLIIHFLALPTMLGDTSQPLAELSPSQEKTLIALAELERFKPPILAPTLEGGTPIQRINLFTIGTLPAEISAESSFEATSPAEISSPVSSSESTPSGELEISPEELEIPEIPLEESGL